ncbi:hypothetical protein JW930_06430 [Candidatus Woesearchaeota archaeon]|nr:hypothetical protein [Candidatus Woesearchaeota archaeon]
MKAAPKGQEFVFSDGTVVPTIGRLVKHIKDISPEQYAAHVNEQKNDIYNWVYYCINKDLAEKIKGNIAQREMVEKLTGHHWHNKHKKRYKY